VGPGAAWGAWLLLLDMGHIRGAGSLRERRPDVWEVRVALGPDPVSGRGRVRSITVHGDHDMAQAAQARWAAEAGVARMRGHAWPGMTVAQLLTQWLAADHGWRPSTLVGYRSAAKHVALDELGTRRVVHLSPVVLRAACQAWREDGWKDPTIWARVRLIRSAVGCAYFERIVEINPLDGMRNPPHAGVRLHASVDQVREILHHAKIEADDAQADFDGTGAAAARLHRAEQMLLLGHLAANSGARRAELASLQLGDLDGDILTILRSTSNEILGCTKSGRIRRLTLGHETAELWRELVGRWQRRDDGERFGPWLFSAAAGHQVRLTTSCLGHWFGALAHEAGHPDVTLHRLRHSAATNLVSRGDILHAQSRLGHADAATTLRVYSHAMPLTDADAAAVLEKLCLW
jgi:integrase